MAFILSRPRYVIGSFRVYCFVGVAGIIIGSLSTELNLIIQFDVTYNHHCICNIIQNSQDKLFSFVCFHPQVELHTHHFGTFHLLSGTNFVLVHAVDFISICIWTHLLALGWKWKWVLRVLPWSRLAIFRKRLDRMGDTTIIFRKKQARCWMPLRMILLLSNTLLIV